MQVTITGGAGFIGANLCRALADDPRCSRLVVLDDLSTGRAAHLEGLDVDLRVGSILDPEAVARAVQGSSVVVHLAARPSVPRSLTDPFASHEVNATGTVRVLEAARHAGDVHVIVASSSSVYGANPALPKHEDLVPMPVSPYAASKLAAESYALAYQSSFGVPVLAFRFFNVFGPLQPAGHAYAAVIPAFVQAALQDQPLPVHGDGSQTRDFTFVDTVAEVIIEAAVNRTTSARPVNLAFGSRLSLSAVIDVLEQLVGHPLRRDHLAPRAGDVRDSQADAATLRRLFPHVEPVPFDEGLQRTVEWMRRAAADG